MFLHTKTKHLSFWRWRLQRVSALLHVLSCAAEVDQIVTGFYLNSTHCYQGVNLPGEWETVVTAYIFYIPQMKEATNIIGTCSSTAPANRTEACTSYTQAFMLLFLRRPVLTLRVSYPQTIILNILLLILAINLRANPSTAPFKK